MKESSEQLIKKIRNSIEKISSENNGYHKDRTFRIMEVCGTHTMAIAHYQIPQLLPENINLISGPGCPVCVTAASDIDRIIEIIKTYNLTVFTFGDMMRVPGSASSLSLQKAEGRKIKICYSPLDSLEYAKENPGENIMFIAIGFETTAPLTAVLVKKAVSEKIKNFFIYSTHKIIPPALKALLEDREVKVDAFLLPGHVSAIIGVKPYDFISKIYNIPAVISGFEPESIIKSILMILNQVKEEKSGIQVEYKTVVKHEGNPFAVKQMEDVFEIKDSLWRGLGIIKDSGLELKKIFNNFDAKLSFSVKEIKSIELSGCECGNVLKGIKRPNDCAQFKRTCTPDNPLGPCMVSSEGTCAAYFKYYREN